MKGVRKSKRVAVAGKKKAKTAAPLPNHMFLVDLNAGDNGEPIQYGGWFSLVKLDRSQVAATGDREQRPQQTMHAHHSCVAPVSYTHLTLPTICSV